jgi:hypothetical protein
MQLKAFGLNGGPAGQAGSNSFTLGGQFGA